MCVLRAGGDEFDVDAFMQESTLNPYAVFHRGDSRFPDSRNAERRQRQYANSGLKVDVSRREWNDLPRQIEDAIRFLESNCDELKRLRNFPNIEFVDLDFPRSLRIDGDNIVAQFDYLPPELISAAGMLAIGIELSLYPPIKEDGGNGAGDAIDGTGEASSVSGR